MQFWKFFKEERADSTPLKDIKPVEPEFELERPGILNFYLGFKHNEIQFMSFYKKFIKFIKKNGFIWFFIYLS